MMDDRGSDSEVDPYETDNDSRDSDYSPSSPDTSCLSAAQSDTDVSRLEIDVSIDNRQVPNLPDSEFSLQKIPKGQTSSKVWDHFGTLKYKNVVISKVSKLVYCVPCFKNSYLKQ